MELLIIGLVVYLIFKGLSRRGPRVDSAQQVGWASGTNWRVVAPLARTNARLVLRHPAFVAGAVVTSVMLFAAAESVSSWRYASTSVALSLVPLGWMTIVAVNLVTLRPRRTRTEELFTALPTPQPVRTTAMLSAAIGPVVIATILAVAGVLMLSTRFEVRGSPLWAEVAAGVLIVAGSVCVGVGVARWLPNPGFGVLAVILTILIQARFLDVTTWPWNRNEGDLLRFLGFLAQPTSVADDFLEVRPAAWHLVYLIGLIVFMAGVALARDGVRRSVALVMGAGVAVAAIAGWAQTRPVSAAQEGEMVSYLVNPGDHQICETSGSVRFCAYPNFEHDIVDWKERVDSTLAMLPPEALEARPSLEVIQRPAIIVSNNDCSPIGFETGLPQGVDDRVSASELWPADGQVHPPFIEESFPCSDRGSDGLFLAVQTGAWAVGLAPAPHGSNERCTADGQARSAIALWAAAAATPNGAATLRDVIADGSSGSAVIDFDDWDDPPMWGVNYAVSDANLALAMLDLPPTDVRSVLASDWEGWVDSQTPSTALAAAVGLTGVGSPASRSATCP